MEILRLKYGLTREFAPRSRGILARPSGQPMSLTGISPSVQACVLDLSWLTELALDMHHEKSLETR